MRVVHVITGLATGGAERLLEERLARTRHDTEVVVLSVEGEIADRLRSSGVRVHGLSMNSNADVRAVLALTRLLRRLRPDVVHVHLYRALIYGRVAARLAGVRSVLATEHSALPTSTEGRPLTRGVRLLYRLTERLGQVTVAVSSTTKEVLVRYWGIPAERIVVVPNGIDTARMRITSAARAEARARLGLTERSQVVVGAGRLVEGKRFDVLIDAVAALADPSVHLVIAGDGPVREALVRRAQAAGLTDRVHFLGVVEDITGVLAAGDLFGSASLVETYGIAIIEAYAAGLPVAYADCPAVEDLGGRNPRLIKAGHTVAGLTEAIRLGLKQPAGADLVSDHDRQRLDIDAQSRALDDLEERIGRRSGDLAHP